MRVLLGIYLLGYLWIMFSLLMYSKYGTKGNWSWSHIGWYIGFYAFWPFIPLLWLSPNFRHILRQVHKDSKNARN